MAKATNGKGNNRLEGQAQMETADDQWANERHKMSIRAREGADKVDVELLIYWNMFSDTARKELARAALTIKVQGLFRQAGAEFINSLKGKQWTVSPATLNALTKDCKDVKGRAKTVAVQAATIEALVKKGLITKEAADAAINDLIAAATGEIKN